ncbi:hypothetical protein PM10SUCC1_19300 [Propionigenium maris DSM 9537]|uniref:Uncharacterized protein n=1 Tax=Propionigenium maris DSM 9537 TaxID=1123000 RepID=A0A9W6LMK0_9FUSO|nr:hypothetical protein [Propionigenium maris]GLI56416.1 hypothetical protein PM10SUCC1_19300 [Propionigenium maris DSM 9537]
MEKIKIGEIIVKDDAINSKSRDRMVDEIEKYIKGIPVVHDGICHLYGYFLKEYLKCKYLSHVYQFSLNVQNFELEILYILKINNLDVEEVQEAIEELLEKYNSSDDTLDRLLEEIVERFNRVEGYEIFEHWER